MDDPLVELANTADATLAADIRTAAAAVLAAADAWRAVPGWRREASPADRAAARSVEQVRSALAELSADASVREVVAAVAPVLDVWWPPGSPVDAVETLRQQAMHRTAMVRDARRITRHGGAGAGG